jgi:hypothetical protein
MGGRRCVFRTATSGRGGAGRGGIGAGRGGAGRGRDGANRTRTAGADEHGEEEGEDQVLLHQLSLYMCVCVYVYICICL